MIGPDKLAAHMEATKRRLDDLGDRTWQRVEDWTRVHQIPTDSSRGGGVGEGGKTDDRLRDESEDRQAAKYRSELDQLTRRIEADLTRLDRIMEITNPPNPKRVETDWCRSCMRDQGHTEPTHQGRYRDACRFCGEWRAAHGEWPPMHVIRWRHKHPGQRLPIRVVEQAG